MHQRLSSGGDDGLLEHDASDTQQGEPFRCIACGATIEKVLADLGSLTCLDHRPIRR